MGIVTVPGAQRGGFGLGFTLGPEGRVVDEPAGW